MAWAAGSASRGRSPIWTPWKSKRADCSHPQVYACGSEPHRGRRDCEDGEHISHRYVSRYQTARCRRYSARRSGEAGCVGARAREPAPSSPSGKCRSGHARLMFFNSPRRGVPAAPLISVVSPSARADCLLWGCRRAVTPILDARRRRPGRHVSLSLFGLFVLARLTRAASAGMDKTGVSPAGPRREGMPGPHSPVTGQARRGVLGLLGHPVFHEYRPLNPSMNVVIWVKTAERDHA